MNLQYNRTTSTKILTKHKTSNSQSQIWENELPTREHTNKCKRKSKILKRKNFKDKTRSKSKFLHTS